MIYLSGGSLKGYVGILLFVSLHCLMVYFSDMKKKKQEYAMMMYMILFMLDNML